MRRRSTALLAAAALAAPLSLIAGSASAAPTVTGPGAVQHRDVRVCPAPLDGQASCHAIVHQVVTPDGRPAPNAGGAPTGMTPSQIKTAYGFDSSSTAGGGQTIAIVDAYDAPNIESDLGVFGKQFGLPACTTANGCFSKVDQTGGTSYPRTDSGWALEISLDVEWAHAIAPGAKVLLVEASSNSFSDLLAAEDYAKAHAQYVSNSWGGSEFSSESSYDSHFIQSGVSFFVSSGDNGTPAEYPSSSPNVISVGGTSLTSYPVETGWSGSGGGCSAYEKPNPDQKTSFGGSAVSCGGMRATPDVALDADPGSGVSVYDSTKLQGQSGWFTVGGTSASSPMWAARSAVAGAVVNAAYVYGDSTSAYNDIVSGNNGQAAGVGYDLVTGVGSWIDSGAAVTNGGSSGGGGGGGGGSTAGSAHVDAIGPYSAAPHGNAMQIPVHVVDAKTGANLSGATVTITITGPVNASGSGTTGSDGTVTFRLNRAPAGTYTTTVTNLTGYPWADTTPPSYTGCYLC